ncbi:MAG: aldo/keto reductase [Planctomycetota bacterium]|nr:aldo/keto reductase [Planctomycetota bacterium]
MMITDPERGHGPFSTVSLGQSGLHGSRLCLGTMTFGTQMDEGESHRVLDEAFDRGIRFFDTANVYGAGASERILGSWLRGHRDQVVVASKVRYEVAGSAFSVGLSRRAIKEQVEASLNRLEVDCLDILYFHQPDDETAIEESLHAVDDLVREGKVHLLGLSNYASWQVTESIWSAQQHGWVVPRVVQPMYNLLARGIEQELLPCTRHYQLGVVVYNPLAAGLLCGKHRFDLDPDSSGRFEVFPYYRDRYWHRELFNAVERLSDIAGEAGRSLLSLSLQWVLDRPGVSGVLLGVSSLDQLRQNLDAFGDPLSEDVLLACDEVWKGLRGPLPVYNR